MSATEATQYYFKRAAKRTRDWSAARIAFAQT